MNTESAIHELSKAIGHESPCIVRLTGAEATVILAALKLAEATLDHYNVCATFSTSGLPLDELPERTQKTIDTQLSALWNFKRAKDGSQ